MGIDKRIKKEISDLKMFEAACARIPTPDEILYTNRDDVGMSLIVT